MSSRSCRPATFVGWGFFFLVIPCTKEVGGRRKCPPWRHDYSTMNIADSPISSLIGPTWCNMMFKTSLLQRHSLVMAFNFAAARLRCWLGPSNFCGTAKTISFYERADLRHRRRWNCTKKPWCHDRENSNFHGRADVGKSRFFYRMRSNCSSVLASWVLPWARALFFQCFLFTLYWRMVGSDFVGGGRLNGRGTRTSHCLYTFVVVSSLSAICLKIYSTKTIPVHGGKMTTR